MFQIYILKTNNIFTHPHQDRFAKSSRIHMGTPAKQGALLPTATPSLQQSTQLVPSFILHLLLMTAKLGNNFFSDSPSCYITGNSNLAQSLYFSIHIFL